MTDDMANSKIAISESISYMNCLGCTASEGIEILYNNIIAT